MIELIECDTYNTLQEKIGSNIIKITDQLQLNNLPDPYSPSKKDNKE
jgi:hypothetical protein